MEQEGCGEEEVDCLDRLRSLKTFIEVADCLVPTAVIAVAQASAADLLLLLLVYIFYINVNVPRLPLQILHMYVHVSTIV